MNILNPQTYPIVGKEWEVQFKTKGIGNLIITPVNETTWGDAENPDLEFVEVKCGEKTLAYELIDNSVIIKDYQ